MTKQATTIHRDRKLARMKRNHRRVVSSAGPRYTPGLHDHKDFPSIPIEEIADAIQGMCRTKPFWERVNNVVESCVYRGNHRLSAYRKLPLTKQGMSVLKRLSTLESKLKSVINREVLNRKGDFGRIQSGHSKKAIHAILKVTGPLLRELRSMESTEAFAKFDGTDARSLLNELQNDLWQFRTRISDVMELLDSLPFKLANNPVGLLLGEAGSGKTHFACDIAGIRLDQKLPTAICLAKDLDPSTSDLWTSISAFVSSSTAAKFNGSQLLAMLDSAVDAGSGRALVIVDGVNEADFGQWRRGLKSMLKRARLHPKVAILMTCRVPFEEDVIPTRDRKAMISFLHPGFAGVEVEAQRAFFSYYRLPAPEVPLLSREFGNPLFLKVMCQSLERLARRDQVAGIRRIAVGKTSFTTIFEDYVREKQKQLRIRYSKKNKPKAFKYTDWLWRSGKTEGVVKEAAELMAKAHSDSISRSQLDGIIVKYVTHKQLVKSVRQALLSEGVFLQDLIWRGDMHDEVLRFPYQKISDHLIVRSTLSSIDCQNKSQVRALFSSWRETPNLLEALMIEFPNRSGGKELFECLSSKAVDVALAKLFLLGLYWREERAIVTKTAAILDACIRNDFLRNDAYATVVSLCLKDSQKIGVLYLENHLLSLRMVERDRWWTEFIRHSGRDVPLIRLVSWLLRSDISQLSAQVASSYAEVLMWALSTTRIRLRDQITKALYEIGKIHPKVIFDAAVKSLEIDDLYIRERMLAAGYGVAMWLHSKGLQREDRAVLRDAARQLFAMMFSRRAIAATTHAVVRDTARQIIELCLLHSAETIRSGQLRLLRPPYTSGGVRRWRTSSDLDRGRYRDGNAPIQMDFNIYVVSPLGQEDTWNRHPRRPPDVVGNVFWRLYSLGYRFSDFAEIDRDIAMNSPYESRVKHDEHKIERYGKKYSWIAYYELFGYRQDRGLLKREGRPGYINLDPSFPDKPLEHQAWKGNLLGNRRSSLFNWIKRSPVPPMWEFLHGKELSAHFGSMILLDGYACQEDEQTKKRHSIWVHSFLVKETAVGYFISSIKKQDLSRHWLTPIPEDYYVYAGEYPWSVSIFGNGKEQMRFDDGFRMEKVVERDLYFVRAGKRIEDEESRQLLSELVNSLGRRSAHVKQLARFCREHKVELKSKARTHLRRVAKSRSLNVEVPVRQYMGRSFETAMGIDANPKVLSVELARFHKLRIDLDNWNFVDKDDSVASCTTISGKSWGSEQHTTYIRRHLLTEYLRKKRLRLVWVIRGLRDVLPKHIESVLNMREAGVKLQSRWQQIYLLDDKTYEVRKG